MRSLASLWRAMTIPRIVIGLTIALALVGTAATVLRVDRGSAARNSVLDSEIKGSDGKLRLTASQWDTVSVQPVEEHVFRSEFRTEGKIALDQNLSTRIFAPYAGRVTELMVASGDHVEKGQLLFVIAAADSVDAQKDFVVALTTRNKAVSQVNLAQIVERRMSSLAKDRAASQREWQEAQANLTSSENDSRSAEVALEAARNRLRLVGKTDAEIEAFEKTGALTPDAPVYAPLAGTVLQRKVGMGQYVNAGASESDPVFLIGDTSKVWIVAYVRETDVAKVQIGERLMFKVLTQPDHMFETRIDYVAPGIDPDNRRLLVRATVDNADGLLKPEMFASVTIVDSDGELMPAVPLESVIYEGSNAHVWVVGDDQGVELRQIKLGQSSARLIQVLDGLRPGEKIVTRGSLFIDRMAVAKQT